MQMKTCIIILLLTLFLHACLQGQDQDVSNAQIVENLKIFQKQYEEAKPNSYEYFESIFNIPFLVFKIDLSQELPEGENDPFATGLEKPMPEGVDTDLADKCLELFDHWERVPTESELKLMVKQKKITKIQPDFVFTCSKDLRETIQQSEKVYIFEGRLRGFHEDYGLKWKRIGNEDFVVPSREATAGEIKTLRDLIGTDKYFTNYRGAKACGSFQADYMVEWQVDEKPLRVMICNGCHEIKITHGDKWYHHDFGDTKAPDIKKRIALFDHHRTKIRKSREQ